MLYLLLFHFLRPTFIGLLNLLFIRLLDPLPNIPHSVLLINCPFILFSSIKIPLNSPGVPLVPFFIETILDDIITPLLTFNIVPVSESVIWMT